MMGACATYRSGIRLPEVMSSFESENQQKLIIELNLSKNQSMESMHGFCRNHAVATISIQMKQMHYRLMATY